uniref:Uncharacterized protein n=1 Tax=Glossina austeni TaxID=7395 RepID=A0A1A9VD43_GLOAU
MENYLRLINECLFVLHFLLAILNVVSQATSIWRHFLKMRLGETIKCQLIRAQLIVDFDSLLFQLKRATQSNDRPSMRQIKVVVSMLYSVYVYVAMIFYLNTRSVAKAIYFTNTPSNWHNIVVEMPAYFPCCQHYSIHNLYSSSRLIAIVSLRATRNLFRYVHSHKTIEFCSFFPFLTGT